MQGQILGFYAQMTSTGKDDEGLYVSIHEDWQARMQKALALELAAAK